MALVPFPLLSPPTCITFHGVPADFQFIRSTPEWVSVENTIQRKLQGAGWALLWWQCWMQGPGNVAAIFASGSFPKPILWLAQIPGRGKESGGTISLVLEDRVALPSKLFCAAQNSLLPGPARGDCPILHCSFPALWPLRVLHPGPWSQLLPLPAPQPVHSCVSGPEAWATRWLGEHLACSVRDPRWPCRCCAESFPPPPLVALPPQSPPNPSGGPKAHTASGLAGVCPQSKLSGSSASFWRKCALWTGEEASFILSVNHFIHIRGLCVLPSFPTTPPPQAPASPGTLRRQEQRKEQVVNEHTKYEGKRNVLLKGSVFWKVEVLY